MEVLKVIEMMASSNKSWEDAAMNAAKQASQSIKNIKSVWVQDQSIKLSEDGEAQEYRITAKITFEIEEGE